MQINGRNYRLMQYVVEITDFSTVYRYEGKIHREGGPAIIRMDGVEEWYINGKLHRKDGPAVIGENGHKQWYIDGNLLTESEFNDLSEQFLKYDGHAYGLILPEKLPYGLRRNP